MNTRKIMAKDANGHLIDVTKEIVKVNHNKMIDILSDVDVVEYAYIRTKTLDEINELIEVETYLDSETPITISSMFYKRPNGDENYKIPYNNKFISYETYADSQLKNPTTPLGKLYKRFQKKNFIISAIYRNNNIDENIDPKHWTSVPLGVTSEWPYEWRIERTRSMRQWLIDRVEYTWSYFSYPVLINSYKTGNDENNIECNDDGIVITIKGIKYDLIVNDDYSLKLQRK